MSDFPKEPVGPRLIVGRIYRYVHELPIGCKGGLYRLERFIIDVPSYQEKALVSCVQGKDEGLWFTCTPWNFAQRYELVAEPTPASSPISPSAEEGWTADLTSKGKY